MSRARRRRAVLAAGMSMTLIAQVTPQATLVACLSAVAVSCETRARAGTMTGAATEWTQILNNVALLQQVIHMIRSVVQLKKQCEFWAQNLKSIGSLDAMTNMASSLAGIVANTRGVLYAGEEIANRWQSKQAKEKESLGRRWQETHPGRRDPRSLEWARGKDGDVVDATAFRRIDDAVQLSVAKTMAILDVQIEQFDDDKVIFDKLKSRLDALNSSDEKAGQMQALQLIAAQCLEMTKQLMAIRQVLVVQANAMGEHISAEAQRRQYDDAIQTRQYEYTGAYRGDGHRAAARESGWLGKLGAFGSAAAGAGGALDSLGSMVPRDEVEEAAGQPGSADPGAAGQRGGSDPAAAGTSAAGMSGTGESGYVTSGGRHVVRSPGSDVIPTHRDDRGNVVGPTGEPVGFVSDDGREVIRAPGSDVNPTHRDGRGNVVGSDGEVVGFVGADDREVIRAPSASPQAARQNGSSDPGAAGTSAEGLSVARESRYVTDEGRPVIRSPGSDVNPTHRDGRGNVVGSDGEVVGFVGADDREVIRAPSASPQATRPRSAAHSVTQDGRSVSGGAP